jgi:IS605 OrfB family transposase
MESSPATVVRTCHITLRLTHHQRERCFGLLRSAGDVWAWVIDSNRARWNQGERDVVGFQALCRELTQKGSFGELPRVSAEQVLKRYSTAWFEAAKRRKAGNAKAGFPRKKRRLMPVRWRWGSFSVEGHRVTVATAKGAPPLVLRVSRPIPYPAESVRSVELGWRQGQHTLSLSALVPVADHGLGPSGVAGVDLGIIHPFAVAGPEGQGLLISGRELRAQHRLHLADTKARQQVMVTKRWPRRATNGTPAPRSGSRRWKRLRRNQRRAENAHRRRIRQAQHMAANQVVAWAVERKVGTLVVGNPEGICGKDAGGRQNKRLRDWMRTHLVGCLKDEAEKAGITVIEVDERGTSSTCPACKQRVSKPKGRAFSCRSCGFSGHRDLVGARNIAQRFMGGDEMEVTSIEHRSGGTSSRTA